MFPSDQTHFNHLLPSLPSSPRVLYDKKDWDHLKRSSKTYEACQQGALLGILSLLGHDIQIEKVYKKSTKTSPLLTVLSISHGSDVFDISTHVRTHIDTAISCCGTTKKWASRLIKRSMDALSFSCLLELSHNKGVNVQLKKTRKAEFTVVMQKIKSIAVSINGTSCTLGKDQIRDFGLAVNRVIVDGMAGSNRKSSSGGKNVVMRSDDQKIAWLFQELVIGNKNAIASAFTPVPSERIEIDGCCVEIRSLVDNSSVFSDDHRERKFM